MKYFENGQTKSLPASKLPQNAFKEVNELMIRKTIMNKGMKKKTKNCSLQYYLMGPQIYLRAICLLSFQINNVLLKFQIH